MTEQEQNPEPALTQEQANKYIADEATHCPFCGSDQVEGQSFDYEDGRIYHPIICTACGRSWQDGYTLDSISADAVEGGEPSEFLYRTVTPTRIIIELSGGLVDAVYSNAAADVAIVDHDNIEDFTEGELAEHEQLLKEAAQLKAVL